MSCYLGFTAEAAECASCGDKIPPSLAAFTDELHPPKVEPICPHCLDGLDPHLWNMQNLFHATAHVVTFIVQRGRPVA